MTNSTQFMWGFYNKLLNKDPYISLLITTRISWRCLFVAHLAHLALGKHPAFQPAHGFPPRRSRRHSFDRCGDPYSTLGEKGVTSIAGGYPDVFQLALTEVLPSTFFQIWKLRSLFFFQNKGLLKGQNGNHTIIQKPNQIISWGLVWGIFAQRSFHISVAACVLRKRTQSACHGRQPFHRTPARLLSGRAFCVPRKMNFLTEGKQEDGNGWS